MFLCWSAELPFLSIFGASHSKIVTLPRAKPETELEFQVYSGLQEVLVPEQPQFLSSAKLPGCSAEQFLDMLPPADSMPPKPAGPEPAPPEPLCPKSAPSVALEL